MSVEVLKQSALFKDFTQVGLEILARIAKPRIVLAGKPLFIEGQPAQSLVVVGEGRFQIVVKDADGKDTPVASLGPGEHLSEMAILSHARPNVHLCTAVAEVDSKVVEIASSDFLKMMELKPQACIKLLLAAAQQFGQKVSDCREPLRRALLRTASP